MSDLNDPRPLMPPQPVPVERAQENLIEEAGR